MEYLLARATSLPRQEKRPLLNTRSARFLQARMLIIKYVYLYTLSTGFDDISLLVYRRTNGMQIKKTLASNLGQLSLAHPVFLPTLSSVSSVLRVSLQ